MRRFAEGSHRRAVRRLGKARKGLLVGDERGGEELGEHHHIGVAGQRINHFESTGDVLSGPGIPDIEGEGGNIQVGGIFSHNCLFSGEFFGELVDSAFIEVFDRAQVAFNVACGYKFVVDAHLFISEIEHG